jgi:GAF domain-containing protein
MRIGAAELAQVAFEMAAQPDVEHTLAQILESAQEMTRCDGVGVFRTRGGGAIEIAATSQPAVRRADELQLECREGPCLQVARTADTYLIHDTRADSRWPEWGPQVAELGWLSILSVRLFTPVRTLGWLNLYSHRVRGFDEDDVAVAGMFAVHASIALTAATEIRQLQRAITSRHVIGRAQGMLMERFDLDSERAFDVLRRYSQTKNVKLRAVAEYLIASRQMPDDEGLEARWPPAEDSLANTMNIRA